MIRFGCTSSDRRIGPWECVNNTSWRVPMWRRRGPDGYRNIFNDEVAWISSSGFSVFGPDGLTEESGHFYDQGHDVDDETRDRIDETLMSFGWTLDETTDKTPEAQPMPTVWQRVRDFFGRRF